MLKRQMGHTSANLTMSVYADAIDWRDGERERLRALVEGVVPEVASARNGADCASEQVEQEAQRVP